MAISSCRGDNGTVAENLDIYDANLTHLGVMERTRAHLEGQWHRAFHCWVVSGDGVLFQQRADGVGTNPGLLDVSAAGHLTAGEQSGSREITEELGIEFAEEDLRFLGDRVEVADMAGGHRNREYQSVHMLRNDVPLSGYRPDPVEVSALFWLPIPDGYRLFGGTTDRLTLSGHAFGPTWRPHSREVTRDAFVPRLQRYYVTALIMAERLLAGQEPLAIS